MADGKHRNATPRSMTQRFESSWPKKPSYFTTEDDCKWFRQQAKILQNRTHYIRQQQANELFKQQLADLHATFQATLQQLATQQSTPPTPPAPQETRKEEDEQLLQQAIVKEDVENTAEKQEQQPLYQATFTESTTGSTTKHGSSMPDSKSTLSTIPRLCTARSSGDSAACLSNALLLACQHTMFLTTLPGYIEHSEGIEATGQG